MTKITRFTFRIPAELLERIKKTAERSGVSTNAQILFILKEWLKNNDKNE